MTTLGDVQYIYKSAYCLYIYMWVNRNRCTYIRFTFSHSKNIFQDDEFFFPPVQMVLYIFSFFFVISRSLFSIDPFFYLLIVYWFGFFCWQSMVPCNYCNLMHSNCCTNLDITNSAAIWIWQIIIGILYKLFLQIFIKVI